MVRMSLHQLFQVVDLQMVEKMAVDVGMKDSIVMEVSVQSKMLK